jgi:hypothetical protein
MEHELKWLGVLTDIGQGIEQRLARGIPTTEDTVRYYFFLRLMRNGIQPESMILERPHPNPRFKQKEVDLSVICPGGMWDFEVKYHRPIPSGRNRPFTQLRGQLISDLYKLALSDGLRRYLLYVADQEMAAHCERHMEMLMQATRTSPVRLTCEWLAKQPETLKSMVRQGLGFLPEDTEPAVWIEASWAGDHLTLWSLGVKG